MNLKDITQLPVAESTEGLNLIVNDNGSAKQIPANAVGAQADWNVTDETDSAFIKNKPFYVNHGTVIFDDAIELELYSMDLGQSTGHIANKNIEEGKEYSVTIDDETVTGTCTFFAGLAEYRLSLNFSIGLFVFSTNQKRDGIQVEGYIENSGTKIIHLRIAEADIVKKIEDKYLPDSVKSGVFIMDVNSTEWSPSDTAYGNKIKNALLNGKTVYYYDGTYYFAVLGFEILETTTGEVYLKVYRHGAGTTGVLNGVFKDSFQITL